MNVEIYRHEAEKYKPDSDNIKVLFIAESPPPFKKGEKPRYFYFKENKGNDLLFSAIVKAVYNIDYRKNPELKVKLLNSLKKEGYFLIDACEYPLNKNDNRDEHIKKNFPELVEKIKELQNKQTKIILIKYNVFDLLNERLKRMGFNVLNRDKIRFPWYPRARETVEGIRSHLK